jgi:hypothetical protein
LPFPQKTTGQEKFQSFSTKNKKATSIENQKAQVPPVKVAFPLALKMPDSCRSQVLVFP